MLDDDDDINEGCVLL